MKKTSLYLILLLSCVIQQAWAVDVIITMNTTTKTMTLANKATGTAVNVGDYTTQNNKNQYQFSVADGTYILTGYAANGTTVNGTIELDISADNHNFQIWTVTTKATNSQWAYGTDYTVQDISLRTREGKIIPITLGENNQTTLALEGTSFNCSLTPSETRIAEGYLATYVSATLNANATCNAAIPMGGTFTVKFPSSANFALCRKMGGTSGSGSIHYVPFVSIEPTSESSDGATTTRTYRLGQGYTCNYRLWQQGKRTKAGTFVFCSAEDGKVYSSEMNSLTFTAADLQGDPKAIDHDPSSNSKYNVGNILVNINERGHLRLSSGQTKNLFAQRDWQLTNNATGNYFIEPDYHYTIVPIEGNPISIDNADTSTDPWPLLHANSRGTAIVLVNYDAIQVSQWTRSGSGTTSRPYSVSEQNFLGGNNWGACWPENTAVYVVSVDEPESNAIPNMIINENYNAEKAKVAGKYVDAEHDVFYYLDTAPGAYYSFTPGNVSKVEIAYPTIKTNTLSFDNGFQTVAANPDGSYTLLLKHGRQIVRLTDTQGAAIYQVLTAKPVTRTITNKTREGQTPRPGDQIAIQYTGLYHPANKMSAIYNMSAFIVYNGIPDDAEVTQTPNQYQFAGTPTAQCLTVKVPNTWDVTANPHFMLSQGALEVSGFGDPIGNHRLIDKVAGRSPNFTAISHQTFFGQLPDVDIALADAEHYEFRFVSETEADSILVTDADNNRYHPNANGYFRGIAGNYTYKVWTSGYKFVSGSLQLTDGTDGTDASPAQQDIVISLSPIQPDGWDGDRIVEPETVTADEASDENGEFHNMEGYYKIKTGFHLAWVAHNVNVNKVAATNFVLCNDISLSDCKWSTIGNAASSGFKGKAEGNGHTISGLYTNATSSYQSTLFGYCDGVTIRNLTVKGQVSSTSSYLGGVVSRVAGTSTLYGITSQVDVTYTGTSSSSYTGGLVGWVAGSSSSKVHIEHCIVDGNISSTKNYVGGLIGYNSGNYDILTITDCAARGSISGGNYVGGIIPAFGGNNAAKAKITNCYVSSKITATGTSVGALWAGNYSATGISNCYSNAAYKLTTNQGTVRTATQFANGTVAASLGNPWGQKLGVDILPQLDCKLSLHLSDKSAFDLSSVPSVTISDVSYTRQNLDASGWYTCVLPFDFQLPEGVTAIGNAAVEGTTIRFEELSGTIEANTPFLYRLAEAGDVTFSATDVTVAAATQPASGALLGTYTLIPAGEATGKLILNSDGTAFATATETATIPAFRAYIEGSGAGSNVYTIMINDDPTGLEELGVKRDESGVDKSQSAYDLSGRKINSQSSTINSQLSIINSQLPKGIYIVNGKKISKQ